MNMRLAELLLASYDPNGDSSRGYDAAAADDDDAADECSTAASPVVLCVSHASPGAAAAAAVVVAQQPCNPRALVIIARVAAARCNHPLSHNTKPVLIPIV